VKLVNDRLDRQTMQLRLSVKPKKQYHPYATIRVKFPNCDKLLQGTFRSNETVGDLKKFIKQHINVEWAKFTLRCQRDRFDDNTVTLSDVHLVPKATVHLTWDEVERRELLHEQGITLSVNSLT